MTEETAKKTAPAIPPTLAPYGRWPSPLTAEAVFGGSESITFLRPARHGQFFLLSLPEEGNIQVLMHRAGDGAVVRVTAPGFNVRSGVHEYGGLPYAFDGEAVYFCNFTDQRVYRQEFDQHGQQAGEARPLTPETAGRHLRYADFLADEERGRLLCVREDHREPGQPRNALVALDPRAGGEGQVLFEESDFVASPRLSPDGSLLVFQTWSHPNMPWDDTQLRVAELDAAGLPAQWRVIGGKRPGALVQPLFHPRGDLYFIADWRDWWNLYRVEAGRLRGDCGAEAVFPLTAEFCPPQWQLGHRHYDFLSPDRLLVSINRQCFWELALLDLAEPRLTTLADGLGSLQDVFCQDGRALFSAATPGEPAAIHMLDPTAPERTAEPLHRPRGAVGLPADLVSVPRHISYPTGGGGTAHGLYYPPLNPRCRAPKDNLPPLLVSVHGGPTSSARAAFNPALQFWTSRGYAVLDVNHRGSTGYGREYRRGLYGRWGEADVEDVINAVRHLVATGRAAADGIFIRGGSAGGYVVLAALAESGLFRAGASYYGIGDLELLARDTHKFESRYLDQLIGPWPQAAELYQQRSPLRKIERIAAPVLLLQGTQDKVVPPNQAQGIYDALHERIPATRLILFEGEGHGFRDPRNQIEALEAELAFYDALLPRPA